MAVAVVILTDHHTRRLHPFVPRVVTDIFAMGDELRILLAREQGTEVVVEPSATVVSLVDDDSFLHAHRVGEELTEHRAETLTVHGFDMDIADGAVRQRVDHAAIAVHPTAVEQLRLCRPADGTDDDIEVFLLRRVVEADMHALTRLTVEERRKVSPLHDLLSVDGLDNVTLLHTRVTHGERPAVDDLLDLQTVTLVVVVEEHAEGCRRQGRTIRIVTGTGMRAIELAEHLREHVAEVVVVVDIRQELRIGLLVSCPVDAMQLRIIELILDLLPDMVEDIRTLRIRTVVEVGLEADGLLRLTGEVDLPDAVVVDIEVLEVLVRLQTVAHALHHDLRLAFHEVVFPQVVASLEACLVIERVTTRREDRVGEV